MKISPRLRRVVSLALVAAAFAFLGFEIADNLEQLRTFQWTLRPAALLASVGLLALLLLAGVLIWGLVLRRFGTRPRFLPLARAWFLSSISRYIPAVGVVWQFVSLAELGSGAGLAPLMAVSSLLVQMGFMLLAAGLVGVLLLPTDLAGPLAAALPALRLATPLALLAVHPGVIRFALRHSARLARRDQLEWAGGWWDGVWLLALSVLAWAGYGIAFFVFLQSFLTLPLHLLPAVTAINALAFVVGYLAFFAPGGLGFKEAALTLLLAGMMPPAVAASLAVAARLWSIAAEAIPAIVLLPGHFRRRAGG